MPIGSRNVHPSNFDSYRHLRRDFLGARGWYHLTEVGKPVDVARNIITANALAIRRCANCGLDRDPRSEACVGCHCVDTVPAVTHLLWIDDDMVYPPHALQRLLEHNLDFVGGLCHNRRHPFAPVMGRYYHPSWGFKPGTYSWLFDYPQDSLVDVDLTGGAFLLVRREVFESIGIDECQRRVSAENAGVERLSQLIGGYADWWTPGADEGTSEDLAFCRRAKESGYQIKVDTGLDIGHIGEVVVDAAFAKRTRVFEYSQWMPAPGQVAVSAEATLPAEQTAKSGPVATVVITAYNPVPELLHAAVQSAMGQSVPVEVIVVDDGSDDAEAIASAVDAAIAADKTSPCRSSVSTIRHSENLGISAALNTGIKAMGTDWFCWLPCDDLFLPRKVEMQLAALLATKRRCSYHGFTLKLDNHNQVGFIGTVVWPTMKDQQEILAAECAINGTTVMIHREVFDKVGLFDPSFKYGQDWEMWNRIGREYFWHGMFDRLAIRREGGNLTERIERDAAMRERRNSEDNRIRRMYAVRVCPCCGEVQP
jgi:GT2 family glycosyltransferase